MPWQRRLARARLIQPRPHQGWKNRAFAACYPFSGNGELTGAHWITEFVHPLIQH